MKHPLVWILWGLCLSCGTPETQPERGEPGEPEPRAIPVPRDNHAPTLGAVAVTPDSVYADTPLIAIPSDVVDADGDEVRLLFQWYRNGRPIPGAVLQNLPAFLVTKGDVVAVEATPFDGMTAGKSKRSPVRTVQNSPPALEQATIVGSTLFSDDTLQAGAAGWTDTDGDPEQYFYSWWRNGEPLPQSSANLSGSMFQAGDTIAALVIPFDGEARGTAVWASPVTIRPRTDVAINEIAWMGTMVSLNDEWIELVNAGRGAVDLSGWVLQAADGTPAIVLQGVIPPRGFFLLERTDDATVPSIAADILYEGALANTGELLELRDASGNLVDSSGATGAWFAGDLGSKRTMERHNPLFYGTQAGNWYTSSETYAGGFGTPKQENSHEGYPAGGTSGAWYQLYVSQHRTAVMPSSTPRSMAVALRNAIDNASLTIDFAIYGIGSANLIHDALVRAQARGVRVRGVVDSDANDRYSYRDTSRLVAALPAGSVVADGDARLMHNKFFVFDGTAVWTGSANVSRVELVTEYAANVALLIHSQALAAAYTREFEEMFAGRFHGRKRTSTANILPRLADGSHLEVFFGPQDDATRHAIIRTVDAATVSLDGAIFYLTDPDVAGALSAAHARGVAVRVLADAEGATDPYAKIQELRSAGVPAKVENWGGFLHQKMLVADGYMVVIGSQNWTSAGNEANDENTLYIENAPLAQSLSAEFELAWQSIPEAWEGASPLPESEDSPGSLNDLVDNDHDGLTDEGAPERLSSVSSAPDAINVYFNKGGWTPAGSMVTLANQHVNLEQRLLARIEAATASVDVAVYDFQLLSVAEALVEKAGEGVPVRLIVDGKKVNPLFWEDGLQYEWMRLLLEIMARGKDGKAGTADDVALLADSPVFAVENAELRTAWGLPGLPVDLPWASLAIGNELQSGRLLVDAERKAGGAGYYAASDQMHNKFAVFDGHWVWTGSWNFTVSGLYGTDALAAQGVLGGNTEQVVEIHSPDLAAVYTVEFQEMWGSTSNVPDPNDAKFHARKTDNTAHTVQVGTTRIEVYFSPGDHALEFVAQRITEDADYSADFLIYSWSDQRLLDALKVKWEGSPQDATGTATGFAVRGVFDNEFWDDWWSASIDMLGLTVTGSTGNPNTRWAIPPPVFEAAEDRKLHSKSMIVDAGTESDPFVIVGSTNWSANGNAVNDENLLIIHDPRVAAEFAQDFWARYYMAGGDLPGLPPVVGSPASLPAASK